MKYKNTLPPGYKSHLSLLSDQWNFIQALQQEEFSILPPLKQSGYEEEEIFDTYSFDIEWLKARAMEEVMEFLPSPAFVEEIYRNTQQILGMKYEQPNEHPMDALAKGLVDRLLKRN